MVSIVLATNPAIRTESWYSNAVSIYRGGLLYALQLGENLTITKQYTGGARDYAIVQPAEANLPWNIAIVADSADKLTAGMVFQRAGSVPQVPFAAGESPVAILATVRVVHTWPIVSNAAAPPPASPVDCSAAGACGAPFVARFVPFGSTHLRMSTFPWATKQ